MWMECFDIYARTFIHIVAIEYIKQHWYSVTKHTNRDRDRDTNKCHHQRQSHRKHTHTTLFHFAHLIPFETYIHSNSVFQLISKCFTISIKWNKSHLLWLRKIRSMNSKLSKNSRFSMYRNVWPCIRWNHSVARICIKLSMAQNLFCVYIPTTKWNQMSKKKNDDRKYENRLELVMAIYRHCDHSALSWVEILIGWYNKWRWKMPKTIQTNQLTIDMDMAMWVYECARTAHTKLYSSSIFHISALMMTFKEYVLLPLQQVMKKNEQTCESLQAKKNKTIKSI